MGPSLDLSVRRTQQAAPDVMKQAMRQPAASDAKPKKIKNVERSKLLGKQGRLHMPRQDVRHCPPSGDFWGSLPLPSLMVVVFLQRRGAVGRPDDCAFQGDAQAQGRRRGRQRCWRRGRRWRRRWWAEEEEVAQGRLRRARCRARHRRPRGFDPPRRDLRALRVSGIEPACCRVP